MGGPYLILHFLSTYFAVVLDFHHTPLQSWKFMAQKKDPHGFVMDVNDTIDVEDPACTWAPWPLQLLILVAGRSGSGREKGAVGQI